MSTPVKNVEILFLKIFKITAVQDSRNHTEGDLI
jgi:hypothetical protein